MKLLKVILDSGNSWISEIEVHKIGEEPQEYLREDGKR